MKRLYIQPEAEFEKIDTSDILAGSGKVVVEDYTDTKDQDDINPNLKPGDGTDFAKQTSWCGADFEYVMPFE